MDESLSSVRGTTLSSSSPACPAAVSLGSFQVLKLLPQTLDGSESMSHDGQVGKCGQKSDAYTAFGKLVLFRVNTKELVVGCLSR
jgi:hypothetical protein